MKDIGDHYRRQNRIQNQQQRAEHERLKREETAKHLSSPQLNVEKVKEFPLVTILKIIAFLIVLGFIIYLRVTN